MKTVKAIPYDTFYAECPHCGVGVAADLTDMEATTVEKCGYCYKQYKVEY